ncbi:MAG: phosphate/phosphite/phosphonate ABC transporter substrate-binding protein [Cyanobacteria bacterium P01_F01_bin.53]
MSNQDRLDAIAADSRGAENLASSAEINVEQLKIAITPSYSKDDETTQDFTSLETYLTEQLGFPVAIELADSYDDAIELMANETTLLGHLGPFSYIKAKSLNSDLEPIVTSIQPETGRPWYTSVIVVNVTSDITNLSDIKGKHFSFVNDSSTSGFLVPTAAFKDLDINPELDFSAVSYSGSHDKNIDALAAGEVDAVAIAAPIYLGAKQAGKLPEEQFVVIWESDPIPGSPVVINTKIPEELQNKIKEVFVNAPPEVVNVLEQNENEGAGYTLVRDDDYRLLRHLRNSLGIEKD